jgi:RHS repeat-associated protein
MGSTTIALNYDAFGRLVRKDVNGTPDSHFLWDGGQLLAELDGLGSTKRAEYSYYPGMDRLHALIIGTTIYYAHSDATGSVIALTDASQNIERTYSYGDVWGTMTGGSDNLPFNGVDRSRWKGALLIVPELNLYYMRARWYEGGTGRFLSEDPLGLGGGMNPYIYAHDDPINGQDPSGLKRDCRESCGSGVWSEPDEYEQDSRHADQMDDDWFQWLEASQRSANVVTVADLMAVSLAALSAGYEGTVWTASSGFERDAFLAIASHSTSILNASGGPPSPTGELIFGVVKGVFGGPTANLGGIFGGGLRGSFVIEGRWFRTGMGLLAGHSYYLFQGYWNGYSVHGGLRTVGPVGGYYFFWGTVFPGWIPGGHWLDPAWT